MPRASAAKRISNRLSAKRRESLAAHCKTERAHRAYVQHILVPFKSAQRAQDSTTSSLTNHHLGRTWPVSRRRAMKDCLSRGKPSSGCCKDFTMRITVGRQLPHSHLTSPRKVVNGILVPFGKYTSPLQLWEDNILTRSA